MAGELLKKKREDLGLDLKDVSHTLRISSRYLRAIEEDDLSKLPGDVYLKGYVREYARLLGLDPGLSANRYIADLKGTEKTICPDAPPPGKHARSIVAFTVAFVLSCIIILSGIYLYTHRARPLPKASDLADTAGTMQAVQKDTPVEQAEQEYKLNITAIETTWLRVEMEDGRQEEALMKENESKEWLSRSGFNLKIGNAGGIRMTLNGKDMGVAGKRGQVISLSIPQKETASQIKPSDKTHNKE